MLFVEAPPAATTVPAADSDGVDGGQDGGNNNNNDNKNNKQETLPDIVQEMMQHGATIWKLMKLLLWLILCQWCTMTMSLLH